MHLSSCLTFLKDRLHTMPKYAKFSANISLGTPLSVQKVPFHVCQTVLFFDFFTDSTKEMGC